MTSLVGGLFDFNDRLQIASLNERLQRSQVITANVANAETPGFRALGYDFESQLQDLAGINEPLPVSVSHPKHLKNNFTQADGTIRPDVYIRPTESIPEDGNTVDVDHEMGRMAQNQLLYRGAVEMINRKIGVLRYAINGGR